MYITNHELTAVLKHQGSKYVKQRIILLQIFIRNYFKMKQQLYVEVWNILATTPGKPSLPVICLLFVRCFQTKTQFIFKPYNTI